MRHRSWCKLNIGSRCRRRDGYSRNGADVVVRETARLKADRILLEGRLVIVEVNRLGVVARVRGEGRVHTCRYAAGAWTCTCEVRTDQCSHLIAVRRVVAVDITGRGQR